MKTKTLLSLAAMICSGTAMADNTLQVPAECKNLALMQAELINTRFHDNQMTGTAYNPASLTLKTNNGFQITKVEDLGGDGEGEGGNYPCDKDPGLCTNPADAGGAIEWARLTVSNTGNNAYEVAEVIVSMGSRGGCSLSSAKYPQPK